jgi:hypothetical protein
VQPQLDFGFAEGLRALMRQDPDIIMVGEIRDLETAEMAVQAALTGHLVFSTLHTNDAPSAVTRLMELGVPAYLINATLLGVLAQRLVRTLCKQCRVPDEAGQRADLAAAIKPWKLNGGYRPYKPVGCVDCRMTGFHGAHGPVRAADRQRGASRRSGHPRARPSTPAPPGRGGWHAPAAPGRCPAGGRGASRPMEEVLTATPAAGLRQPQCIFGAGDIPAGVPLDLM